MNATLGRASETWLNRKGEKAMPRAFATVFLGLWLAMPVVGQAITPEDEFFGVWKQVFSTGGYCSDCTVSISRGEDGLRVEASNGWTASLDSISVGGKATLVGEGKWEQSRSGQADAREVATGFQMLQGHLVLVMQIADRNGGRNRVQAIFERSNTDTGGVAPDGQSRL